MDRDEILKMVMAEHRYWQQQMCDDNPCLQGIQIGAMGACSNIIAAIATGKWMSTQIGGVGSVELRGPLPDGCHRSGFVQPEG